MAHERNSPETIRLEAYETNCPHQLPGYHRHPDHRVRGHWHIAAYYHLTMCVLLFTAEFANVGITAGTMAGRWVIGHHGIAETPWVSFALGLG